MQWAFPQHSCKHIHSLSIVKLGPICACNTNSKLAKRPITMAERGVPPQLSQLAKNSSLFSTASFHEHMRKKDTSSRSVLALGQNPDNAPKRRPRHVYENTYKLEPERKFQAGKVKAIIEEVLEKNLKDEKYDPRSCRQMVKTLSEIIKGRVRDLDYKRYKIVCMVSIGQLNEQGYRMGSRCCWDAKWDTFATANYTNKTLFAIATVWGVYYE